MVVTTLDGVVHEGEWEDSGDHTARDVELGMMRTLTAGEAVGLVTPNGAHIIPATAVSWVQVFDRP